MENELTDLKETMTSLELFEMLDYKELKTLHLAIRNMFKGEIKDGTEIIPSLDSRGYVQFYTLNEVLSSMFVASKNRPYFKKITKYWIDKGSKEIKVLSPSEVLVQSAQLIVDSEKEQLRLMV